MGMVRKSGVHYRLPPSRQQPRTTGQTRGPPTVYIREGLILDQVDAFFNERLFGAQRHALPIADQDDTHTAKRRDTERRRQALQKKIADAAREQDNLLRQAENADPDDTDTPSPSSPDQANLLDALPYLKANLRHAPGDLLDLTQLPIKVHYKTDQATLPADPDSITSIGDTASRQSCAGGNECASCECPR